MIAVSRAVTSRLPLLLTCAPLLWGCASLGTLQTADTVKAGHGRWNLQGVVQAVEGREPLEWLPQGAVEYRHGVVDGLDIGGKLGTGVVEASVKVALMKSEDSPWRVSLMPTAGLVIPTQSRLRSRWTAQLYGALPVLVGYQTEGGSQVVLGLRPTWMDFGMKDLEDERDILWGLGASVGYAFRLSARVRLMPEVAALVPVAELNDGNVESPSRTNPNLQVGLAFMVDN
jgi:hypothetical protein